MVRLFPEDYCVCCFHPPHGDVCQEHEYTVEDRHAICGCDQYITEHERGQIDVSEQLARSTTKPESSS